MLTIFWCHVSGAQSDSELSNGAAMNGSDSIDRGYTSDSELYETQNKHTKASAEALSSAHGSWLLVSATPVAKLALKKKKKEQSSTSFGQS